MKISGNTLSGAKPLGSIAGSKSQTSTTGTTSNSPGAGASSSTGSDPSVQLSHLEQQFAQADFNAGKVGDITDAIASGQYQVNAGAIADKLIQSALSMSGSGKP
jgi:negative regulator of flagellin synthesis FlgM